MRTVSDVSTEVIVVPETLFFLQLKIKISSRVVSKVVFIVFMFTPERYRTIALNNTLNVLPLVSDIMFFGKQGDNTKNTCYNKYSGKGSNGHHRFLQSLFHEAKLAGANIPFT